MLDAVGKGREVPETEGRSRVDEPGRKAGLSWVECEARKDSVGGRCVEEEGKGKMMACGKVSSFWDVLFREKCGADCLLYGSTVSNGSLLLERCVHLSIFKRRETLRRVFDLSTDLTFLLALSSSSNRSPASSLAFSQDCLRQAWVLMNVAYTCFDAMFSRLEQAAVRSS